MLPSRFQQQIHSPEGMKLLVIDGRFVDAPDYHPSLCEVVLHKELEYLHEDLESLELLSEYPSDCIQVGDTSGNPKDVTFMYNFTNHVKSRNHSLFSHSRRYGVSTRDSRDEILLLTWFDGLVQGVNEVVEKLDAMWAREWVWKNSMWMGSRQWERDENGNY